MVNHPLADLLPLLDGDEFDALVQDIRDHGLRQSITLFEGKILDGRNRLAACKLAKVVPRYTTFKGSEDEAIAYVVSLNISRRHLTTTQRAALAVKLLPYEQVRAMNGNGQGPRIGKTLPVQRGRLQMLWADRSASPVKPSARPQRSPIWLQIFWRRCWMEP